MASSGTVQGFEVWTIRSPDGGTMASFVPELGGTGSSLIVSGPTGPREVFYRYDFFWDRAARAIRGGWPFLFPICGRLERDGQANAYAVDGTVYRMPIHGFAPYMPWNVVKSERPDELKLQLTDTTATREVYPFAFEVLLTYRLESGRLVCEQSYTNRSDRPMPFYAGFHPYFVTPPPGAGKEKVRLYYEPKQRLLYNERFTAIVGEGDLPEMPVNVADPKINEALTIVGDQRDVRLEFPDGLNVTLRAEGIESPDWFRYIQLYTKPDHPFFCVEPWMSPPNSLNTPGAAILLAPGQTRHAVARVSTSCR